MENFSKIISEISKDKKSNAKKYLNACDSLVEILYKRKQELTRVEIINEMLALRLEVDYGTMQKFTSEVPEASERKAIANKMWKTCKNGIDTAISDSSNNSSFSYNEKYAKMKLKFEGGKYKIIDAK